MSSPVAKLDPVAVGCAIQSCGDVIYRSTLDAKLRLEEGGLTLGGGGLLAIISAYLTITPGAGGGLFEHILAPYFAGKYPRLSGDLFEVDTRIGEGGFGKVFRAKPIKRDGALKSLTDKVVIKKALEFGLEEKWMNERMMRVAPGTIATYIGNLTSPPKGNVPKDPPPKPAKADAAATPPEPPVWLLWNFEEGATLASLMESKDFPYNAEVALFGAPLDMPEGPRRKSVVIRALLKQTLEGLAAMHGTGIVHRDVKPENLIVTNIDVPGKGRVKFIDFGAAADLRLGINYAPKQYLLDDRYCAPEQYIMSTQTPQAPPALVAIILSPVLWQLNLPDRFDMYSVGVMFLQMVLPSLRSDNSIIKFRDAIDKNCHDLEEWRDTAEKKASTRPAEQEGWDILDLDDGAGWELVKLLVRRHGTLRPSADQMLRHPFMAGPGRIEPLILAEKWLGSLTEDARTAASSKWVLNLMARSGTQAEGGFTEAQMERIQDLNRVPTKKEAQKILGKYVAETVAERAAEEAEKKRRRVRRPVEDNIGKTRAMVVQSGMLDRLNFWGKYQDPKDGECEVEWDPSSEQKEGSEGSSQQPRGGSAVDRKQEQRTSAR